MAKKKSAPAPAEARDNELIDAVTRLADEVRVLRESIDELRADFQHAVLNGRVTYERQEPPLHVVSMPLDPAARDFGSRVNAVPESVVSQLRETASHPDDDPVIETSAFDPQRCWENLHGAWEQQDWTEVHDLAYRLLDWLADNGEPPRLEELPDASAEERREAAHAIAREALEAALAATAPLDREEAVPPPASTQNSLF